MSAEFTSLPPLEVAVAQAAAGRPVLPLCWVASQRRCGCGQGHKARDVGKAPIGYLVPNGVDDATTDRAKIEAWWRRCVRANVGVALARSRLVMVDPDSDEAQAEVRGLGLPPTTVRVSHNAAAR